MKTTLKFTALLVFLSITSMSFGQEIKTLFGSNAIRSSGGYGALTNKFTKIGGNYANMSGIYAGWYINHKIMIGVSGAAVTNDLPVPLQFSTQPGEQMSYEYGQTGLMTEYVVASNRAVHIGFQLFAGSGFTTQYIRNVKDDSFDSQRTRDTNWFVVTEPGVNVELNVFKWMRFCSGVSYRNAFGSEAAGLKDKNINGMSLNVSLKFGKF